MGNVLRSNCSMAASDARRRSSTPAYCLFRLTVHISVASSLGIASHSCRALYTLRAACLETPAESAASTADHVRPCQRKRQICFLNAIVMGTRSFRGFLAINVELSDAGGTAAASTSAQLSLAESMASPTATAATEAACTAPGALAE